MIKTRFDKKMAYMAQQPKNLLWVKAVDLGRERSCNHPFSLRRTCSTSVKKVVNLVLDPPGNVVILTPDLHLYISASLGYHMRHRKEENGGQKAGNGTLGYTLKESEGSQGLPEFSQGSIQWGSGAVSRTPDGRLAFHKNKAIGQGRNLFHNQPIEIISNTIETYKPRKTTCNCYNAGNKYVGAGGTTSVLTDPNNHWQRSLRTEVRGIWKPLHDRAMPIAQTDEKHPHLEPRRVTIEFTTDLCTIL